MNKLLAFAVFAVPAFMRLRVKGRLRMCLLPHRLLAHLLFLRVLHGLLLGMLLGSHLLLHLFLLSTLLRHLLLMHLFLFGALLRHLLLAHLVLLCALLRHLLLVHLFLLGALLCHLLLVHLFLLGALLCHLLLVHLVLLGALLRHLLLMHLVLLRALLCHLLLMHLVLLGALLCHLLLAHLLLLGALHFHGLRARLWLRHLLCHGQSTWSLIVRGWGGARIGALRLLHLHHGIGMCHRLRAGSAWHVGSANGLALGKRIAACRPCCCRGDASCQCGAMAGWPTNGHGRAGCFYD